jgi:hypothetical protein
MQTLRMCVDIHLPAIRPALPPRSYTMYEKAAKGFILIFFIFSVILFFFYSNFSFLNSIYFLSFLHLLYSPLSPSVLFILIFLLHNFFVSN